MPRGAPKGRRCAICQHPQRPNIDLAIATGISRRLIAARFKVSADAAWRHGRAHLTPEIPAALATKVLARERDMRRILLEGRDWRCRSAEGDPQGEREDLLCLVRQPEKVLKSVAAQRSAELLADFQQQLASRYTYDQDEIWRQAVEVAQQAVAEASSMIAARCVELGIPDEFAPRLQLTWWKRGQNAVKDRCAELLAVGKNRIAAIEKRVCVEIEVHTLQLQTQIAADGLASASAREFLERMPTVETLTPPLHVAKIEHMHDSRTALESPRARSR
jgi:hypothetical protein